LGKSNKWYQNYKNDNDVENEFQKKIEIYDKFTLIDSNQEKRKRAKSK